MVYTMCTQKNTNHTEEMYKRYQDSFREYLKNTVLPAVQALEGEPMVWTLLRTSPLHSLCLVSQLKELVRRWESQKLMRKYLSGIFFKYLVRCNYSKCISLFYSSDSSSQDRYHVPRHNLDSTKTVGGICLHFASAIDRMSMWFDTQL
jgi:hypothetical protein